MGKLGDSPAGFIWAYTCGFSQQGWAERGGEVYIGLFTPLTVGAGLLLGHLRSGLALEVSLGPHLTGQSKS